MREVTGDLPMRHEPGDGRRERGAVLAISLMLMTIMTLLAISTMRTATLELMMTGHAEYKEKAFQAAQTGLAVAISLLNDDQLPLVAAEGWKSKDAVTGVTDDSGNSYSAGVRYLYRGDPPPGTSPEGRKALYFEIEVTGRTRARNARSVQTQGFWILENAVRPINLTYWFPNPDA